MTSTNDSVSSVSIVDENAQNGDEYSGIQLRAKTMHPRCLLPHICRGDIFTSLNNHSRLTSGGILVTDISEVIEELVGLNRSLAPGATLGFPIDVVQGLEKNIGVCDHRLDFPISRQELMMAINFHSKFDANEKVIKTNLRDVVQTVKSLNRPLTPAAFFPVGFPSHLQNALLDEIRCIDDPNVQVPIDPNVTFPEPPPGV